NRSPATQLPSAYADSTALAASGCPRCSAKATLVMSTVPTTTPIASISNASRQISGCRSNEREGAPPSQACSGGSVPRCSTSSVTPTTSSRAAASTPACGHIATDSPTDNGGPAMKVTSSNTVSSE